MEALFSHHRLIKKISKIRVRKKRRKKGGAMFSEGPMVEFKREFSKRALKTVVAFANTNGGVLYLGIEDDGSVCGLDDPDAVLLAVTNAIRDSVKPNPSMIAECEKVEFEGKTVVGVRVERGVDRPYYLADKGMRPEGVYVREGAASYMACEAEIATMLKASRRESFDSGRSLRQNLTFEGTRAYFEREGLEFGGAQMRSLRMVDQDGQFTNLAWLLSDQCDAVVKLADFFGVNRTTFKDRLEVTGSVLVQFDQALKFLAKHLHYKTKFVDMRRVDYEDFPPDAVREALINAIIHRDYEIVAPTLVSVLEDRIEFTSHGGPPVQLSLSEFEWDVSVPRNPLLAEVFYRVRLIEAYGTGIKRIFEAYEGSGVSPEFNMSKHLVRARLPNRNYDGDDAFWRRGSDPAITVSRDGAAGADELRDQERLVFAMLEEFGPMRRADLQERFEFSQATLLRILGRLKDKGLVRAEGNTRRRVYRVAVEGSSAAG